MRKHATNPLGNIFCRVTGQGFRITEFVKDKESLLNGPRWEGMKPGQLNAASAPGFCPGAKGVSGKTRGILVLFTVLCQCVFSGLVTKDVNTRKSGVKGKQFCAIFATFQKSKIISK